MKNEIKKIGEQINVTCPTSGKTQTFTITGRNFSFDRFVSYMVGYSAYGRTITTVNPDGTSQFRLF